MLFSDKKFHTCAFPPSLPLSGCDNIAFLLCLNDVTLIWEKEQNQLVLWQNTEKVSIHWSQWKRCSKKSAIILMMVKLKKCTFVNTIFIWINDFLFFSPENRYSAKKSWDVFFIVQTRSLHWNTKYQKKNWSLQLWGDLPSLWYQSSILRVCTWTIPRQMHLALCCSFFPRSHRRLTFMAWCVRYYLWPVYGTVSCCDTKRCHLESLITVVSIKFPPPPLATWSLSFSFFTMSWLLEHRHLWYYFARSTREALLVCVCWKGGHGKRLQQRGCHTSCDGQIMSSTFESKILRGKKGLENADKAEGRATFRNKVNFILVRTIKGWNFMQRFWPTNRKTTPQAGH